MSTFDFILTGHKLNAFIIYPLNKLKDAQIFLSSKVSQIPLYAAIFIFSQKSMIVLIQEDILQPPVAKNTTESRSKYREHCGLDQVTWLFQYLQNKEKNLLSSFCFCLEHIQMLQDGATSTGPTWKPARSLLPCSSVVPEKRCFGLALVIVLGIPFTIVAYTKS